MKHAFAPFSVACRITTSVTLAGAFALLSSCGGHPAPTSPVGTIVGPALHKADLNAKEPLGIDPIGDVPPEVAKLTDRIWKLAAKGRKLDPKANVKLAVLTGAELVEVVKSHVKKEIPADDIRAEGKLYETLGLVPVGFDYEAETYALLEEQLAGLYMPEEKTMYVARGIEDTELEATLAHELVHALQDQYFQIGARMKYRPGVSDELSALQDLAEGDATSAMIDEVVLAAPDPSQLPISGGADMEDRDAEDLLEGEMRDKPDSLMAKAPRFIALGLVAPYADGATFVNSLRRRAGWSSVDTAWTKTPPTTTEQILHLDKYDAREPAIVVSKQTGVALGADWKATFDDVFGEEGVRLAWAELLGKDASKRAAAGWGGDRVTLFEGPAGKHAVAWTIAFDDEKEAKEAQALVTKGYESSFGAPQSTTVAGAELAIYGIPPKPSKTPSPPPKKDPKSALPTLPDPKTGSTTSSWAPKTLAPDACRAWRRDGKILGLVIGPCDKLAAWSAEAGKT